MFKAEANELNAMLWYKSASDMCTNTFVHQMCMLVCNLEKF